MSPLYFLSILLKATLLGSYWDSGRLPVPAKLSNGYFWQDKWVCGIIWIRKIEICWNEGLIMKKIKTGILLIILGNLLYKEV